MKSLSQYGDTITKLSEFVKNLDQSIRSDAFNFLLAQECAQLPANAAIEASPPRRETGGRAVAPQELIRKSKMSSFKEKAMILAYWLEEHQQKTAFSSSDLKAAFEQAREQSPKNVSDLVAKLEGAARIMKAESSGAVQHYRLTSTAIEEIEGRLLSEQGDK